MSCRLTGLPPDWLASLPALRDLNLRSNLLLEVDGREFRNAPRLFRMDLSYNPIGKLPVSKIGGKKQLLKLSLLPLLPPSRLASGRSPRAPVCVCDPAQVLGRVQLLARRSTNEHIQQQRQTARAQEREKHNLPLPTTMIFSQSTQCSLALWGENGFII
jgi:hypothetical protein